MSLLPKRNVLRSLKKRNVPATHVATQAACVYSFTATAEREIAQDVKENLSYISLDYDTGHKSIAELHKKKTYELPDRNINSVPAVFQNPRHFFPVHQEVRR